jgi:hypothetical protein
LFFSGVVSWPAAAGTGTASGVGVVVVGASLGGTAVVARVLAMRARFRKGASSPSFHGGTGAADGCETVGDVSDVGSCLEIENPIEPEQEAE